MTIAIKIGADIAGATNGLRELQRAIEKTGQAGKALRDIKIDKGQFGAAADELARVQQNAESYLKTAHGRQAARTAQSAGFNPKNPLEWVFDDRMYTTKLKQRMEQKRLLDALGASQAGGPSAVDALSQLLKNAGHGAGGVIAGGASGVAQGLGLGGLMRGGLFGLAAYGGFKVAQNAANMVGDITDLHEKANLSLEGLYKTGGYGGPYEELINQSREAATKLGVLTHEAGTLATSFMRASGAADKDVIARSQNAGLFARGYGLDPAAMVQRFAQAERMGIGGQNQRQFAALLAEAIASSPMKGNPELVMDDLLKGIQRLEETMASPPTTAQMERFAALRSAQWQNPALRGSIGDKQLSAVENLLGAQDPARVSFIYDAFRKEIGGSLINFAKLQGASIFQTAKELFGAGDDTEGLVDRVIESSRRWAENFTDPGKPNATTDEKAALVLSKETGLKYQEASALLDASNKVGGSGVFKDWLKQHGNIDLSQIKDFRQYADLAGLVAGGRAQELRQKYLGKDVSISASDRSRLEAARTESEILRVLPEIIMRAGINDPADKIRDLATRTNNYLEQSIGPDLLAASMTLTEIKQQIITGVVENLRKIADAIGGAESATQGDYDAFNKSWFGRYSAPGAPNSPTGRAQQGSDYLRSKGISDPRELAAILGNSLYESKGMNPGAQGPNGDYGLFQWTGVRKKKLFAFLDQKGLEHDDFTGQLDFFLQEYLGSESQRQVRAAGSLKDKVSAFRGAFERPPSGGASDADRMKAAVKVLGANVPNVARVNRTAPEATEFLKKHLAPGKSLSHLTGLEPSFADRLAEMIEAMPDDLERRVSIYSGHRSEARQRELFAAAVKKYGSVAKASKWVAPPGKSHHLSGTAADLNFGGDAAQKWIHRYAGDFGLNFPMAHEPWHIEPIKPVAGQSPTEVIHKGELTIHVPYTDEFGRRRVKTAKVAPSPKPHSTGQVDWFVTDSQA